MQRRNPEVSIPNPTLIILFHGVWFIFLFLFFVAELPHHHWETQNKDSGVSVLALALPSYVTSDKFWGLSEAYHPGLQDDDN